jgi:Sigma-54 interaction domain
VYRTIQTSGGLFGILLRMTATLRNGVTPRALESGSAADWRRAARAQHNMLLEGAGASIETALQLLAPCLRQPVTWNGRACELVLPADKGGTLIVQNIALLDGQDQLRLRVWLNDPARRTQVVSTTTYPLFPLVDCGVFDATLFYRLNVMQFSVDQN